MKLNDDDLHDLNDAFDYLIGCYNIFYGNEGYDKFMDQLRIWLRNQGYKISIDIGDYRERVSVINGYIEVFDIRKCFECVHYNQLDKYNKSCQCKNPSECTNCALIKGN